MESIKSIATEWLKRVTLGVAFLWGAQASAATIDLSTGTATYSLIAPGVVTGATAQMNAAAFPANSPYLTDLGSAKWISRATTPNDTAPVGDYYFQTTFDLTGLSLTTASIIGSTRSDNALVDVILNGVSLGITSGANITTFNAPLAIIPSLNITTGFLSGINTLTFIVNNTTGGGGNPVGFLTNATLTAQPVPLPAAVWLLGGAMVGLVGVSRRRRV